MSVRSLKVAPRHIQRVKDVLQRRGFSQRGLATELGIARSTVSHFFTGKVIDRLNFIECCEKLGLDWQEIADKPSIAEHNPNFVGRESAIADLNALVTKEAKVILIQGAGGVGKTTLARKYLADKFGNKVIEFPIAKETKDIAPIEGLLEQCLRSLGEEPGGDFWVFLTRLKEKLQTQAMGVLIDNLEPALDRNGRLIEGHRRYLELLRVLADPTVKSITLITSREALGETLDISLYRLPILTLEAWQTYFQNRKILCDTQEIKAIWNAYQGNALAMKLLSERILLDHAGNVAAFWQEQQKMGVLLTMDNLIKEQLDRLENIDLNAYHLLCRMGCFRYQDVPTVPLEGLFCLLWDVAENQRSQVVNALKSRSLVDVIDGEYQLHPLIREEAINRFRNSEDWEKINRQAAEFWTKSVKSIDTVKDALRAFEAGHHYLNIDDYGQASQVILMPRNNKFESSENLGEAFSRLSLFQQMIVYINNLIPKLDKDIIIVSSRLYDLLGGLYGYKGNIYQAIECYQISRKIAEKCFQLVQQLERVLWKYLIFVRMFNMDSQSLVTSIAILKCFQILFWSNRLKRVSCFNIGLCKIDVYEIDQAISFFEEALSFHKPEMSYKNGFNKNDIEVARVDTLVYVAFLDSCLSEKEKALNLANQLSEEIEVLNKKSYFDSWARGYHPLFLGMTYKNLGDINKSFKMYDYVIQYAEKSHFKQVKAKALTGLGELYRIQKKYDIALIYHFQSIEILDKIGAKCDLAEAYFQLALSYQAMGDQPNSQTYFEKALDFWGPEQIDAPKQIERVKKAMQTNP